MKKKKTTSRLERRYPGVEFSLRVLQPPSQGGVKQDVGCRGLDGGGGDFRHLVVIELVPALFQGILTVGCVMAAI